MWSGLPQIEEIPSWELTCSLPRRYFWVHDFPYLQVGYGLVPWRVARFASRRCSFWKLTVFVAQYSKGTTCLKLPPRTWWSSRPCLSMSSYLGHKKHEGKLHAEWCKPDIEGVCFLGEKPSLFFKVISNLTWSRWKLTKNQFTPGNQSSWPFLYKKFLHHPRSWVNLDMFSLHWIGNGSVFHLQGRNLWNELFLSSSPSSKRFVEKKTF